MLPFILFSKAPYGCNIPHGAKHLICNQLLYSIRNERELLNGVYSPLLERLKEYHRVYHISMLGNYGKQLISLML